MDLGTSTLEKSGFRHINFENFGEISKSHLFVLQVDSSKPELVLTQYLIQGEKIAPNSMSSRVQQLRASIRTELLTSLAVLQCELNDLFPCLK